MLDLRALLREYPGRYTLKKLADQTHMSKSSFGAATSDTSRLPSEDTVRAMVTELDPGHQSVWLKRRSLLARTLAARSAADLPPTFPADTTPVVESAPEATPPDAITGPPAADHSAQRSNHPPAGRRHLVWLAASLWRAWWAWC